MDNFIKLTKINLQMMLSNLKFLSKSSNKTTQMLKVLGLIYLLVAILVSSSFYIYILFKPLAKLDLLAEAVLMISSIVAAMLIITNIFEVQGQIFKNRDGNILHSLPLSNEVIFFSKLSAEIVFSYILELIIFLPMYAFFVYFSGFTLIGLFNFLLMILVFPLIPIIISTVIAFVISALASKGRNSNARTIMLFLVFTLLMIIAFSFLPTLLELLAENADDISKLLNYLYYPAYLFKKGFANANFISAFALFVGSIGIFYFFIRLFAPIYKKINQKLMEGNSQNINRRKEESKQSSVFGALLKKDLRKYVSSPMYFLNTFIGVVFMLLLVASTFFVDINTIKEFLGAGSYDIMLIASLMFCAIMCMVTAPSISIEGKKFWILSSLPVEAKQVYKSKILMQMLVIGLPAFVLSFVFGLKLNFGILNTISITFYIISLVLCSALIGIFCNLNLPKFDAPNDTMVVKQSASVLLTMLINFILIIVPIVIGTIFSKFNIFILLAIFTVCNLFLSYYIYKLALKKYPTLKNIKNQ